MAESGCRDRRPQGRRRRGAPHRGGDRQRKVAELGAQISARLRGPPAHPRVSVLKGSLPFMADLMRAISIPLRIDLMEVSSYGGVIHRVERPGADPQGPLAPASTGEDVLLVEDIIDTGLTLNYLLRYLRGKDPRSLKICALLDKPARRLVEIPVDYTGFTIPDQFVVGLRAGLRRAVPQPALRGRPAPRGLRRRRVAHTAMHRRPLGRGRAMAGHGRARPARRLRPAVVDDRRAPTGCRRRPATRSNRPGSSCSSPRWRCWPS